MKQKGKQERGAEGEKLATAHLQSLGYEIVHQNCRVGRGEIDIIARDGETLVFCEVKTRYNDEFGRPEYALTSRKQRQLRKLAEEYFFERDIKEQECRFDVVAIMITDGIPDLNYIKNAF